MESYPPRYNSYKRDAYAETRARLSALKAPPGNAYPDADRGHLANRPPQQQPATRSKPAARMSKERAQALARACKRWLMVSSVGAFALFSGLVAYHQVGTTGAKSTTGTTTTGKSSVTTQVTATATASSTKSKSSGSSLKQKKGNNLGTHKTSSGTSSSSATPTPVTSSSVS